MFLALAPRLAAEQLPIRSYTSADGLAGDQVNCIVQDRYGFYWFCTQEGLSRFDGYTFATFGHESGLPGLEVLDLLETGNGEYWVATGRGLCRFDAAAARCEAQALDDRGTLRRVQALLKDSRGRLWVGTNEGLFRSEAEPRNGAFRAVTLDPALASPRVIALAESGDGSLWVVSGEGVWRILPDGRRVFHQVEGGGTNEIGAIHADARGRIWIGHFGPHGGVTVFASVAASALPPGELPVVRAATAPHDCPADLSALAPGQACIVTQSPFPRQGGTHFSTSSDGMLWVSTLNAGLLRFEGSRLRRYTTEQGLSNNALRSVLEDRSGDLWIGTESRGVMRWARRGMISYGEADGISPIRIVSLFTGQGGDVYALNSRSILNRFDGRGFEAVRPNVAGSITMRFGYGARLALQGRSGDWWVASDYGLQRFTGIRRLQDLSRAHPAALVAGDARAGGVGPVFEDSRGDVWAGADGRRLVRWQRETGALRSYVLPDDLPRSSEVTAFAEDRAGTVWVGLGDEGGSDRFRGRSAERGGLVRIRGDVPEVLVLDRLAEPDIRWLHTDRSGRLWFAAGRGGLGRIDDPTAARPRTIVYGRAEGLSSEMVLCVAEDRRGRVYVGTDMGVDRLEVATGRVRHLGVADGLVADDVVAATADHSGRLWFGTPAGLSLLTPEEDPKVALPAVRIMSLRIGGLPRPISGLGASTLEGLELSTQDAPIEIAFAGVAPALGWKRQYRFQLEGVDKEWSAPTDRHEVSFTRLSPGAYRFVVQAWSEDAAPSAEPSFVAFRILPPVWRRGWFLSAAGLMALTLAYVAFRYRLRMLLEVERVRIGIATDLHDDIGSNLSQIAILSEVARRSPQEAAGEAPLASIAQLSREIVGSMSDIVWAVNPQRDSLHDLTRRMRGFASETFGAMDVRLRFSAPPDEDPMPIPADLRRQVFLIFKEAATNAAVHSRCREVTVDLELEGDWLTLRVEDDGRGMEPEGDPEGHGLRSMAERARALGGELHLRSEPGRGTTVTLRAPFRRGGWGKRRYASM